MFGIPIDETYPATHMFCNKKGFINNTMLVKSTLNKKHSSVAYRWNVATSVIKTTWIPTGEKLADAFNKLLPSVARDYLFGNWTY